MIKDSADQDDRDRHPRQEEQSNRLALFDCISMRDIP